MAAAKKAGATGGTAAGSAARGGGRRGLSVFARRKNCNNGQHHADSEYQGKYFAFHFVFLQNIFVFEYTNRFFQAIWIANAYILYQNGFFVKAIVKLSALLCILIKYDRSSC